MFSKIKVEGFQSAHVTLSAEQANVECCLGAWCAGVESRTRILSAAKKACAPYMQENETTARKKNRQEKEKRRQYQQRICEVEHGSFTPLVFSTTGGMGRAASVTFKRLAAQIAEKRKEAYSQVVAWIRTLVSFSLLRSSITALRGCRTKKTGYISLPAAALVVNECRLH